MYRSPVKTRSTKAPTRNLSDKRKPESQLSVDFGHSADKPDISMEAAVEACVAKHLSTDKLFDRLAERLADRIEKIVEDVVAKSLKAYINEVNTLRQRVTALEERLRGMENDKKDKCEELEQYQRRNNIRVFGVPESAGEDTDNLVVQLFQEKLGVEVAVEQIDRSHRTGRRRDQQEDGTTRHRPIMVKFLSYRDRRRVFSVKKRLKGSGITIAEDLTTSRRELLQRATEKFGRGKTWTVDGRVMWVDGAGKRGMATRLADIQ